MKLIKHPFFGLDKKSNISVLKLVKIIREFRYKNIFPHKIRTRNLSKHSLDKTSEIKIDSKTNSS